VTSPYNGISPPCLKLSQQFVVPAVAIGQSGATVFTQICTVVFSGFR
jgi:hypothetical protein